jgi:3-phosphoshikimate 1-carboxyvinyltransferase
MVYKISHPTGILKGSIALTSSKSESNRALIIRALCEENFEIRNLAKAQDTQIMDDVLKQLEDKNKKEFTFDLGMGGTTMRFLTAYLSTRPGTYTLTGTARMKERPLGILINALRDLGADIECLGKEGFAPIRINGKALQGGEVEIDGTVSSQYISALLLIATEMKTGLVIRFKGEVTSRPYINMTLKMLEEFRVYGIWQENMISVSKQFYHIKTEEDYAYQVEGDWSAASYYYALTALSNDADITIYGLNHPSLQGDSIVSDIYAFFGVSTEYIEGGIRLRKHRIRDEHFGFDFSDCPDLAQTIAITAAGMNIPSYFNGLHTLRIKETDRIEALKDELKKTGVECHIDKNAMTLTPTENLQTPSVIETYEDHRMAMSFAALSLKLKELKIADPFVVKKSYPAFWEDLKKLGFVMEEC